MFSSLSLLLYSPCTMNLRGCCDTKPASSTLSQSIHDRSMYESRLLCAYELGQHLCARRPTLPAQGRASVSLRAHDLRWQASSCVNDGSLLFAPTKALVGHTERGLEIRRLRADSPLPARSKGKTQKLADRVSQKPVPLLGLSGFPSWGPSHRFRCTAVGFTFVVPPQPPCIPPHGTAAGWEGRVKSRPRRNT